MSMKTTRFAVGTTVALNADLADMFPSMHNIIFEIVDSRMLPGGVVYTLRNPNRTVEGVPGDDLHEVGYGR